MIVVQYVPCTEDEQGHLQCRGLYGRLLKVQLSLGGFGNS